MASTPPPVAPRPAHPSRGVPPPLRKASSVSQFIRRQSFVDHDIKEMKDLFSMCDSNTDGSVSKKELLVMMKKLGIEPTKAEFNQLWDQLDVDQDGELSFEEFLNGMKWLKKGIDLIPVDDEEEPLSPNKKPTKEELDQKTTVLSKYVQMVIENSVKEAKALQKSGNKTGAQAVLHVLDLGVILEMEKALEKKLISKELKAAHDEILKEVGKA